MTSRQKARKMVNIAIIKITGGFPTLDDLPDSVTLCAGLDSMEGAMEYGDVTMSQLLDMAQDVAFEVLEEEGFPC